MVAWGTRVWALLQPGEVAAFSAYGERFWSRSCVPEQLFSPVNSWVVRCAGGRDSQSKDPFLSSLSEQFHALLHCGFASNSPFSLPLFTLIAIYVCWMPTLIIYRWQIQHCVIYFYSTPPSLSGFLVSAIGGYKQQQKYICLERGGGKSKVASQTINFTWKDN